MYKMDQLAPKELPCISKGAGTAVSMCYPGSSQPGKKKQLESQCLAVSSRLHSVVSLEAAARKFRLEKSHLDKKETIPLDCRTACLSLPRIFQVGFPEYSVARSIRNPQSYQ